jgi:probable phosphoglycerate mutase
VTQFVLVRHGPTLWNAEGRIQGRTDIPLSDAGRAQAGRQRIPAIYGDARWVCSPLIRAVQTAELMGCPDPELEPALMEMNWGEWEGLTQSDLERMYGPALRANEDRGLDFRPAGGESPREVRQRVLQWMMAACDAASAVVAVTHKGVIRAALSCAEAWDMTGPPPLILDWTCAHVFVMDGPERLELYRANVPLQGEGR